MAFITQTGLKDLKYGKDQQGGGNSGQPYITHPIPEDNIDSNKFHSPDNMIRGGFAGAVKASTMDAVRVVKYLKDSSKGPLFIIKQTGLQLSNPKLEEKNDISSKLLGTVGNTRLYSGVNFLAQIPLTAFGQHINRHGVFPIIADKLKYENIVRENDAKGTFGKNNRLVKLVDKLKKDPNAYISRYIGGPNSLSGVGVTTIRRYYDTLSNSTKEEPIIKSPEIDYYNTQGLSRKYFGDNTEINKITPENPKKLPEYVDKSSIIYSVKGKKYDEIKSALEAQIETNRIGIMVRDEQADGDNVDITSKIRKDKNFITNFAYTGTSRQENLPLSEYNFEKRIGLSKNIDEINLTPLFTSDNINADTTEITIEGKKYNINDMVKFRIEAIDGDNPYMSTWMVFRAYLKGISDNPNPSWADIRYIGRGEPFYIYKGFERSISLNFQVAALSQQEMVPMWQKLEYLYSNTLPDYKGGIMRAPYIKLTIGDYLYRQPGVISFLTYTIEDNTPWQINTESGLVAELPHIMNIQMSFNIIHDFLPRKITEGTVGSLVGGDVIGMFTNNNKIPKGNAI